MGLEKGGGAEGSLPHGGATAEVPSRERHRAGRPIWDRALSTLSLAGAIEVHPLVLRRVNAFSLVATTAEALPHEWHPGRGREQCVLVGVGVEKSVLPWDTLGFFPLFRPSVPHAGV